MSEIKDRPLSTVHFSGLEALTFTDGRHAVGATCHISLVGSDGSPEGPGANVFVGTPISRDVTLREAERATLTRVHELLVRLASFSVDELEQAFERKRQADKASGFQDFHQNHG